MPRQRTGMELGAEFRKLGHQPTEHIHCGIICLRFYSIPAFRFGFGGWVHARQTNRLQFQTIYFFLRIPGKNETKHSDETNATDAEKSYRNDEETRWI